MNALQNVDGYKEIKGAMEIAPNHSDSYFQCFGFQHATLGQSDNLFYFIFVVFFAQKKFFVLSLDCPADVCVPCERQAYLLRFYFSFGTNVESTNKNDNKDIRNEE